MGGGRVVEAGGQNRGLVGGGGRRETLGGLCLSAAAEADSLLRLLPPSTAFLMLSCFSAAFVCDAVALAIIRVLPRVQVRRLLIKCLG